MPAYESPCSTTRPLLLPPPSSSSSSSSSGAASSASWLRTFTSRFFLRLMANQITSRESHWSSATTTSTAPPLARPAFASAKGTVSAPLPSATLLKVTTTVHSEDDISLLPVDGARMNGPALNGRR